jgi:hypothetical protein
VIATGSNNTARYFEHYFGKYPHIIRRNRQSVAVLTGEESDSDLRGLADDVFLFFGRGCRSVTKLFVPAGFDLSRLDKAFSAYSWVADHYKYRNNLDYYKSVFLVNRTGFYDGGFYLLTKSLSMLPPVSTIYYEFYRDIGDVYSKLDAGKDQIQCVISIDRNRKGNILPGHAQLPQLWDYADGVDTLAFLSKKNGGVTNIKEN